MKIKNLIFIMLVIFISCTSNNNSSKNEAIIQEHKSELSSFNNQQVKDDSLARIKKSVNFIVRNGWCGSNDGQTNGVHIYTHTNPLDTSLIYYTFSIDGSVIFRASHFKKEFPLGCDDYDKRISYKLIFDTIYNKEKNKALYNYSNCLVVGTAKKVDFKLPVLKEVSEEQMKICIEADTIDTSMCNYIKFYSAGYKNNKFRIFYEYSLRNATVKYALVEISGKSLKVLYSEKYYFTDNNRIINAQADLDFDGFCDTFILNIGDYGGKGILVFKEGIWTLTIQNDGIGSC